MTVVIGIGLCVSANNADAARWFFRRGSVKQVRTSSWRGGRVPHRQRVVSNYTDDLESGNSRWQMTILRSAAPRVYTDDLESGNAQGQWRILRPNTPIDYTDDLESGNSSGAITVLGSGVDGTEF